MTKGDEPAQTTRPDTGQLLRFRSTVVAQSRTWGRHSGCIAPGEAGCSARTASYPRRLQGHEGVDGEVGLLYRQPQWHGWLKDELSRTVS